MMEEETPKSSIELLQELQFQPIRTAVRQSIAVVDQSRKGLREVYPTKWPRLNRQLLGGFQPGKLYIIAGRPGCLSGETRIYVARKGEDGSGRWYTLEYLYKQFNGLCKKNKWDLSIPTKINSFKVDIGVTGLNDVTQVIESGVKETWKVTTSSGKVIRATKDHKFLISTNGDEQSAWKTLGELEVGDEVICKAPETSFGRKPRPYRPEISKSLPYYPDLRKKRTVDRITGIIYWYHRVKRTRIVYDAALNKMTPELFLQEVSINPNHLLIFSDPEKDIHHIDGNCLNDSLENLVLLTKKEHQQLHSEGSEYEKRFGKRNVHKEAIVSIDEPRKEMTYDISMKAPHHNFIAEGFVVHNSGKSAFSNQVLFDVLDLIMLANKKVIVFYWSFEMPGYQQLLRTASKTTGKQLSELYSIDSTLGEKSFQDFIASVSPFTKYPIYFQNRPKSIGFIEEATRRYKEKNPDTLIINLMDHSRLVPDEKEEEELKKLNKLSKGCMKMQAEYGVINILLSQLNRNIEKEDRAKNQYQPLLTDLFGGDSIGQDAHVVMIIQRPHDLYGIVKPYCNEDPIKLMAIHMEKNRDGMLGMIPYDFDGARFTITERKRVK
jgi:replicative DNA helicase